MRAHLQRLLSALLLVATIILIGASVLFRMGHGHWRFSDTIYMALISVSTVGFGELPDMAQVRGARVVVSVIILTGIGAIAYFQSALTAMLVEGAIQHAWRGARMKSKINNLRNHVVVAGVGSTGRHIIEELAATQTPYIAIDHNLEQLLRVSEEVTGGQMLYIHGEAAEDHTLLAAGVDRAKGVIAALTHDKDNLFVTLSARTLNATARIISKVVEPEAERKMLRAGADGTVSPTTIGGRRMVSEMIRPVVVQFLDLMLRDKDKNLRIEEVLVPAQSAFIGKRLREVPFRSETNALVLAVHDDGTSFQYNPGPDFELHEGVVLVVMGETQDVLKLRALLERSRLSS